MYFIRLDDASEYMHLENWLKMELLLQRYNIKPIVGIIPNNCDKKLLVFEKDILFWNRVKEWEKKGWIIALHGYNHNFETTCGGVNPINFRSEFAGVPYDRQCEKIEKGMCILSAHNIVPKMFFPPAHTFDLNTLRALKEKSDINVICDTVAYDIYFKDGFFFISQQSGRCRSLPLKTVTFCFHPNIMVEDDFKRLEDYLKNNRKKFGEFRLEMLNPRSYNFFDKVLRWCYFCRKRK